MVRQITHVIFDMDGLMFNTEDKYTDVFKEVLQQFGKEYKFELKRQIMGMRKDAAMQHVVRSLQLEIEPSSLGKLLEEKYTPELWQSVTKMPGIAQLVNYFSLNSTPMAIATGSTPENFKFKTKNHSDLIDKISHIVTAGDKEVKEGKPSPEIYNVCSKRFSTPPVSPAHVLVFEDAISGVVSGLRAGMNVIWVPDPREPMELPNDPVIQTNKERVFRLKSLLDFDPSNFNLPAL